MSSSSLEVVETRARTRYDSCLVLNKNDIPYVVWFEDAIRHYGVPTVQFNLYILAQDIDIAAECLIRAGWIVDTKSPHQVGGADIQTPQVPVFSPNQKTKTVLLPASDWKFALTAETSLLRVPLRDESPELTVSFPPLPGLLDALIESWLDGRNDDPTLLLHLACQINYLYEYTPDLKERSFAEKLKLEHRQFHLDVISGMASSTILFRKHVCGIRLSLLQGRYELQHCSAPRDNLDLFDPWAGVFRPPPVASQSVE
ncbi:hypothetical protein BJX70DRAFT_130218 [Aspergillus crustosus]